VSPFGRDGVVSQRSECNCSLCRRKGSLYLPIQEITGASELIAYPFNTNAAKRSFCKQRDVSLSRMDPRRSSVNARCLEEFDLSAPPRRMFDGRNLGGSGGGEARAIAAGALSRARGCLAGLATKGLALSPARRRSHDRSIPMKTGIRAIIPHPAAAAGVHRSAAAAAQFPKAAAEEFPAAAEEFPRAAAALG
jgi:hypothetical protein